jgi:tyrosine-protein phosphatase SIW14
MLVFVLNMWRSPGSFRVFVSLAFLAAAAAAAPLPFAPAPAEIVQFAELPNFHRVDDNLFRGGQPGAGGMARLKAVGVRSVLNLRYESEQVKSEGVAAKAAGLRYYNIPMYGLLRPADEKIARALTLFEDPQNWPVFVHCVRGSDRTGAVVACYRIAHGRWTAERAIQEAMGYGMLWIEGAKRAFIRQFHVKAAA